MTAPPKGPRPSAHIDDEKHPPTVTPTSDLLAEGDVLITSTGKRATVLSLLWVNEQRGVQLEQAGAQFGWECFLPLAQVEHYLRAGLWKNHSRIPRKR
jgi:hypothetical protein